MTAPLQSPISNLKSQISNPHSLISNPQLLLILLLAAILRLGWPNLTEFKADEARLLALALDMAEFKSFALRGIGSSVGLPNFPMSVWLYSIPLFVWKHPYSATLFVGALNTLAVYLCYRLTRRSWGETAALTAALFFAASPWAAIYSRKIWAQNLLPLFVLFYIGSALTAFADRRRWFLALHFVALAVVVQIHLSAIAFAPLTALLLVIFWRRSLAAWKEIVIGVAAAALTAVPFGLWTAAHLGGGQSLISSLLSRPSIVDLDSLRFAWMVLCGFDIHSLAGPNAFRDYLSSVPNIDPVRWLWGLLALAGLLIALRRRRPADLILALWFVIPPVFFIRHSTPVFPHYFIITLPAGYMLAGLAISTGRESLTAKVAAQAAPDWNADASRADFSADRHRSTEIEQQESAFHQRFIGVYQRSNLRPEQFRSAILGLTVAVSALAQAAVWLALLFFVGANATPGGFGTPLGRLLDAVDGAKQMQASLNAPEVLIVGDGDDPNVDESPAVMDVLFRGTPRRFVDGNEAAVFPQGGAAAIIQPGEFRARARYENYAATEVCIALRAGELGIELVGLAPGVQIEIANPFPEPRALANGVELLGWESDPVWAVVWRVGYVPAAADYHFFNHAPNGQADGVGYPSRYWRDGDVVISFFDLQPAGPVRVGMYEYPAVINVPVMDAMGNPYSDAVIAAP